MDTRSFSGLLQGSSLDDRLLPSSEWEELIVLAEEHGIQALLHSKLVGSGSTLLKSLADTLGSHALQQAALFSLQHKELQRMVGALNQSGVPFLLVKGAALAYQIYSAPHLRPRSDTDLFIEQSSMDMTVEVLSELGYRTVVAHDGGMVSHQRSMLYKEKNCLTHIADIHWKLSNRHQYRDILDFASVRRSAVPVPGLEPEAFTLDTIHALCHACLHLLGHHSDDPRLIWLYDIYRLVQQLEPGQVSQFVSLVRSLRLENVTCQALTEVGRHFVEPRISQILASLGHPDGLELPNESRLLVLRENLQSFPTFSAKCRYLGSLSFPRREYMRAQYQLESDVLVPWFYVHRIVSGIMGMITEHQRRQR